MSWNLAQAKEHLEEIAERAANDEVQVLEFGDKRLVIVSDQKWRQLSGEAAAQRPRRTMKELLATLPDISDLDLTRNPLPARDIDL